MRSKRAAVRGLVEVIPRNDGDVISPGAIAAYVNVVVRDCRMKDFRRRCIEEFDKLGLDVGETDDVHSVEDIDDIDVNDEVLNENIRRMDPAVSFAFGTFHNFFGEGEA